MASKILKHSWLKLIYIVIVKSVDLKLITFIYTKVVQQVVNYSMKAVTDDKIWRWRWRWSFPTTGLDRPLGFQEVEAPEFLDNWRRKVVRLSALCTGRLYPQEGFLVLISVKSWVDPRATMRPEGLSHWKNPMTPSGIKPMTFWFVVQRLNQLRHHVPRR
jgi:hypothetical protein